MVGLATNLPIVTLGINGCNKLPHENVMLGNCNKKKYLTVCCFQETHLIDRNKYWVRVKGWKKIYQVNGS
jgi:hypothetical protein